MTKVYWLRTHEPLLDWIKGDGDDTPTLYATREAAEEAAAEYNATWRDNQPAEVVEVEVFTEP